MRFTIACFLLLLFGSHASSQAGFGPEIGLGMSSIRFSPDSSFSKASSGTQFSARVGAVADFDLNKQVYVQPGIFFSEKGGVRDFSFFVSNGLNEYIHQVLHIAYVEVPVSVVFKTGYQGKTRFFGGLGAVPAYIIGGSNYIDAHGAVSDTPFTTHIHSRIVKGNPVALFDIGISLKAGFELPSGLFFSLFYTAGMRDIGLGGEVDKNRMWGVAAGYYIGKGRNINKEKDDLIDTGGN